MKTKNKTKNCIKMGQIIIGILLLFCLLNIVSCSKKVENEYISTKNDIYLEEMENTGNSNSIINDGQVKILYTNDVECALDDNIGYSALAEYKNQMKNSSKYTLLVDSGDFLMGNAISSLSKGKDIISIMNKVGYDFVNIGIHDFNYGIDTLVQRNKELNCKMYSSNFINLQNNVSVFGSYKIFKCGEFKIALIGITSPTALYSSDEKIFQDNEHKNIYSFCEDFSGEKLYANIQITINKAIDDGANKIILVGHCGNLNVDQKYSSKQIIANITNVDAFIDGNSEEEIENEIVKDKNDKDVILTQAGSKLKNIGQLTIYSDGSISTKMIKKVNKSDGTEINEDIRPCEIRKKGFNLLGNYENEDVKNFIDNIIINFKNNSKKSISSSYLSFNYKDDNGKVLIRNKENNLGDLLADSIKSKLNTDIAIIEASSIRNGIEKGNITFESIFSIYPLNNRLYSIEASGQQIKEALENSIKQYPKESGSFLQVSGISFDINSKATKSNASKKTNEINISNIHINGEKIDLEKKYTIGLLNQIITNPYTSYTMFKDCKILKENVCTDADALIEYITENPDLSNYSNPNGSWRININD